ncbi:hypothetical protein Pcinc_024265 [Petrolisthes cinctipes]|uniref:Uncharacterized protein n=1 Tax=Petrolisthes cinctipes TaxID=88211 RepID=A0AAE1KFK4_PETCI|nr:hypothetical protein Pcinc_024265 [Petrolisthes cinctipes]
MGRSRLPHHHHELRGGRVGGRGEGDGEEEEEESGEEEEGEWREIGKRRRGGVESGERVEGNGEEEEGGVEGEWRRM